MTASRSVWTSHQSSPARPAIQPGFLSDQAVERFNRIKPVSSRRVRKPGWTAGLAGLDWWPIVLKVLLLTNIVCSFIPTDLLFRLNYILGLNKFVQ